MICKYRISALTLLVGIVSLEVFSQTEPEFDANNLITLDSELRPQVENLVRASDLGIILMSCDYDDIVYTDALGRQLDGGYHRFVAVGTFLSDPMFDASRTLIRVTWNDRQLGTITYLTQDSTELTSYPGTPDVVPYVVHSRYTGMYIPVEATHVRYQVGFTSFSNEAVDRIVPISSIFPMLIENGTTTSFGSPLCR